MSRETSAWGWAQREDYMKSCGCAHDNVSGGDFDFKAGRRNLNVFENMVVLRRWIEIRRSEGEQG